VGEIWLDGPSKTRGYFNDVEKTKGAYNGVIKGEEGKRTYLQTGDQGFLWQGELFFTGRLKDLIVVRGGRTLYPQDIEYAVEAGLESLLRPGCSGSFQHELNGEATVAYVAELRDTITNQEVLWDAADQIRRLVTEEFQVPVSVVCLVEPRSIPKTTSGKIQRYKCKLGYEEGSLEVAYLWEAGKGGSAPLKKPLVGGCLPITLFLLLSLYISALLGSLASGGENFSGDGGRWGILL
jgi:acyl-CoA synthetase (AMP-forming)/AMP-acid ligase II